MLSYKTTVIDKHQEGFATKIMKARGASVILLAGWVVFFYCFGEVLKHQLSDDTLYIMSLLKMGSMLVVGWVSIIWILSPKTLQSWKRPYATYVGPPFGEHVVGPQYSKIPQPPQFPPPILKHQYPSPVMDIYKQHEIMNSPMTYKSGTLRHGGFYPDNV
jgi:hypothetical protein